ITQAISGREFKVQVSQYLATLKPEYPHSLAELIARAEAPGSGYTNPWRLNAMKEAQASVGGLDEPEYLVARNQGLALIRATVEATFTKHQLDALIYPTSPRPALPIEPPATPPAAGGPGSATNIANRTGFPDLIVPAGMTKDGLPVTISFFGLAFSEPKLLAYGYDFEQATHARVLPKYTPALAGEKVTTTQGSFAAATP
ncbi:MAG: amidase family protein, partial [Povalibacter sp.]